MTGLSKAGLESAQKARLASKHAIVVSKRRTRSLTDIDATSPLQVKAEFGTFDLLSISAGFSIPTPVENVTEAVFDEMFNLNAKGPFFAVQKLAPLMNQGGAVVLTTSVANVKGLPGQATYGAAKAALRSLARTLAVELLPREIRVNAVTPGPIDTPILGKVFHDKAVVAQVRGEDDRHDPDEALLGLRRRKSRRRCSSSGSTCDLHDRHGTSGRWGLVATLKAIHLPHFRRRPGLEMRRAFS